MFDHIYTIIHQHLCHQISSIRFMIKYILIIYLFNFTNIDTFFYKLCQILRQLDHSTKLEVHFLNDGGRTMHKVLDKGALDVTEPSTQTSCATWHLIVSSRQRSFRPSLFYCAEFIQIGSRLTGVSGKVFSVLRVCHSAKLVV